MTDSDNPKSPPGSNGSAEAPTNGHHRPAFVSSLPPATADATLTARVRTLVRCIHPSECITESTMIESDGSRLPMQWCGACGAIGLAHGEEILWTRPGIVLSLDADAIARWTSDVGLLGRAVTELARATRTFREDIAHRAEELESATAELERAAATALAEFGLP